VFVLETENHTSRYGDKPLEHADGWRDTLRNAGILSEVFYYPIDMGSKNASTVRARLRLHLERYLTIKEGSDLICIRRIEY
jgi:hypothetical protein